MNDHAPKALQATDIGAYRTVRASVPDTFFTIPARLRLRGKTIRGFVSVDTTGQEFTFTPEADGSCDCDKCRNG